MINEQPFEGGWIIKVEVLDESELSELMSAEQYGEMIS